MKIDADLSQIMPAGWKYRTGIRRQSDTASGVETAPPGNSLISRDPGRFPVRVQGADNKITEALSIAQMAHSVLQQAMVITSRLRNIAMEAMSSKKVNYEELAALTTRMQSTLGKYADRYATVVIPPDIRNIPSGKAVSPAADRNRTVDINEEVNMLRDTLADAARGNAGNLTRIDGIASRMNDTSALLGEWIEVLSREGQKIADGYTQRIQPGGPGDHVSVIKNLIGKDSNAALLAQGNLSRGRAAALLHE